MPGIPQGQEEMPVGKTTKCNAIEEHHIFGTVLLFISRATLYQVMKWHRLGPGHGEALETLVQKTPGMGKARECEYLQAASGTGIYSCRDSMIYRISYGHRVLKGFQDMDAKD
jgi:hypothetical protein